MKKTKYFCSIFIMLLISFSAISCSAACSHVFVTINKTLKKVSTSSVCTQYTLKQECTKCKKQQNVTGMQDKTHNYVLTVQKTPTCVLNGSVKYDCKDCNYSYKKATEKLGHSTISQGKTIEKANKENICTNYVETLKCTKCSIITKKVISSDITHEFINVEKTKATCEKEGKSVQECKVCKYKKTTKLPKMNHNFLDAGVTTKKIAKKALCSEKYQLYICKNCAKAKKELVTTIKVHNYKNGVCTECDFRQPIVFNPDSIEHTKGLQEYLRKLGYYIGTIDGKINTEIINSINLLLHYNDSTLPQLSNNAKWQDVSQKMYIFIMGVTETKNQAIIRINDKKMREINKILNSKSKILTSEQEEIFNKIILELLTTDTKYNNKAGNREEGFMAYINYYNGNGKKPTGTMNFDCSSLASLIVSQVTGIPCTRDKNTSYSTDTFLRDTTNFSGLDKSVSKVDVKKLEKGQLILCIDENGADHIMVYLGNNTIIHASSMEQKVTTEKISHSDEYTQKFLITTKEAKKNGKTAEQNPYDEIYILTPNT